MIKNKQSKPVSKSEGTPNIFKRLFLGFIIVPIIPILAIIYFNSVALNEKELSVEQEITSTAQVISEKIDSWVQQNTRISQVVSRFEDVQSMVPEKQKPILEIIKDASPTITATRIDDSTGQAISRSDDNALRNYADRQYFQQVQSGEPIGQQVIFGRTQQKPLLCFTVPINNEDDLLGTLNQCSTLDDISTNVTDLKIGSSGFAFLVDSENSLIAHGGLAGNIEALQNMASHPAILNESTDSIFTFEEEGLTKIAYKTTTGLGWTLVVQQDYAEAYAKPLASQRNAIIIIVFTLIVCLVILYFLSLVVSKPIQEARKETDNILGAATDGLFLIDNDYVIGEQQSTNLNAILQRNDLAGQSFTRYLTDTIPLDQAGMAKDYIDLLFQERIKEELVQSRNPLNKVNTRVESKAGELVSRYLTITFKRVYSGNAISHLLVTVKDITKEVKTQQELEKVREEKNEQMNLLTDILYIPVEELTAFLTTADVELNKINSILEKSGSSKEEYQDKITQIYRIMHKIKGDASSIKFDLFASQCHEFEEKLERLKNIGHSLTGNAFLPITMSLNELFEKCASINELLEKLGSFTSDSTSTTVANLPDEMADWQQLESLAADIAAKNQKDVELHFKGFQSNPPVELLPSLKDIATQLIRNSVIHGIETIEERQKLLKLDQGQITMIYKTSESNGSMFIYMDDGQGIDYEKIRAKLIDKEIANPEETQSLSDNDLLKHLISNNLSTKEKTDIDGGRGVGLSLVVDKVKAINGKIRVLSTPGKRLIFKILLPE